MINIYLSENEILKEINNIRDGCWVDLTNPTTDEIDFVSSSLNLDKDFILSALDEEERARVEVDHDNDSILIIVDLPTYEVENDRRNYITMPLGIIFHSRCIVTVSLTKSVLLSGFVSGSVKTFYTYKKSRFILQILYRNATLYLQYLKSIEKQSESIKKDVYKSIRNKEIVQLLELENALVYFNTSLKSNESVMEKLLRYEFIRKYHEDKELLEDIIIENKQALEMAKIYSDILGGTMDAFASIISNNQNIQMKMLTSITIIMSIPNIIFSMMGQNILLPMQDNKFAYPIVLIITFVLCVITAVILWKKKMLK